MTREHTDDHTDKLDLAASSPREYVEARRLKAINDAREHVPERADTADSMIINGQIDDGQKAILVFQAVQSYVREVWPLVKQHAARTDNSYYTTDVELGTIEFENSANIELRGLMSILHTPPNHQEEVEKKVEYPQGPPQTLVKEKTHHVPLNVSWYVYDTVNEFLAEVDLDLELDTDDEWEI